MDDVCPDCLASADPDDVNDTLTVSSSAMSSARSRLWRQLYRCPLDSERWHAVGSASLKVWNFLESGGRYEAS